MVYYWTGRHDECARSITTLDEQVRRYGHVVRRPVVSFYRAVLACEQTGASADAVDELRRAIDDFRSLNHLARLPYHLSLLAAFLAKRGSFDEAAATISSALDIARTKNERWCLPEVLRVQASVLIAHGQTDEAEVVLGKSMAFAQESGALSWRLRAAIDLANLWCERSRLDDARSMLLPIYQEFSEGFATRDLKVAAKLVDARVPPRSTMRIVR